MERHNPRKKYKKNPGKKTKVSDGVDKITCLPKPLLHNILSFLDTKEVLQTSFVTKTWRDLWRYVPVLNFDYSLWKESSKKKEKSRPYVKKVYHKAECMDFVDRILFYRNHSSNLEKLRLSWYYCFDSDRLKTWLYFAITRHVKEICLEIPYEDSYVLPSLLFTSSSEIEVFKLKSIKRRAGVSVRLPISICSAARLRTLELDSVPLPTPKDGLNGELVMNYSSLEILVLKNCDHQHLKILNISALKLKKLLVDSCDALKVGSCKIKIFTPNLESLQFHGHPYKKYSLGNLSSVVNAKIGDPFGIVQTHCLVEVANCLPNVITLELSAHHTISKPLDGSAAMDDRLWNPFLHMRCLKLMKLCSSSFQSVTNILKNTPRIETLVLEILAFDLRKDWTKELSLHYSFFNHLKHVKILNLKCSKNELQLLMFLLGKATVLEGITITYTEETSKNMENELADFSTQLNSATKMSAKAIINFLVGA